MTDKRIPTKDEVESFLSERRNWGRWGEKGGAGAINLITAMKRVSAARLVTTGHMVSLSRPLPTAPSAENPYPAEHYVYTIDIPPWHASADYIAFRTHGRAITHIDALGHLWDVNGMWDGHEPEKEIDFHGLRYGSIDEWSEGILTRGVLLDIPRHRGEKFVTLDKPVHGWELEEVAKEESIVLESGDAILVYCGREAYTHAYNVVWGGSEERPGLHASCLPFIRDNDVAILGFDMMDAAPNEYGLPATVHGVIFAYGVALLDNLLLEPLAEVCAQESRYEFMLTVNPLKIQRGTGSPVNPVAVF